MQEKLAKATIPQMLLSIFIGLVATLLILFILSLLTGIVVYYSSMSECLLPGCATAIIIIGTACGGFCAAKNNGSHGLLIGLITASLAAGLAMLFGSIEARPALKVIYYLLPGMLGGIVGVSSSASKQ